MIPERLRVRLLAAAQHGEAMCRELAAAFDEAAPTAEPRRRSAVVQNAPTPSSAPTELGMKRAEAALARRGFNLALGARK
ncbi:MAG: hypothetical protein JW940_14440 [Polyangiaceae bacterium]|nr:hypothetical protein [Polyangiaceae bacterium]